MVFLLHMPPTADVVTQQVSTVQTQLAPVATYRCEGCGELVHFNSLSASCRCIEECYGDASGNGSTGAGDPR